MRQERRETRQKYFDAKIEGKVKQLEEDSGNSICFWRRFSHWIPCGSIIRTLALLVKLNWPG